MEERYDPKKIEPKWQKIWAEKELYKTSDKSDKPKFYTLDMFPYPSGVGLHVGHPKGYIATDVVSRFKMLQRYNVLHPMGWDAFGLPAENYAIKTKTHPRISVEKNVVTFKKQLEKFGFTYDWNREINTTDPEYYKWTQWIFLKMFEKGLAYESEEPVNWCPNCKTVLANEDLEKGLCERCGTEVVQKKLRQWVLRMTAYADRLLYDLDSEDLNWEELIKEQQRNWIGRSEGVQFEMKIKGIDEKIEVYTTRIDTVFGMTYAVVAPEHPIVEKMKDKIENYEEVEKYIIKAQNKTELERTQLQKEKTGVELKGIKVINPFTQEEIPIFVGDYVLGFYGTGAVMAVPAHDERDFEFAKKYNIPIKEVIIPVIGEKHENEETRKTITAVVPDKNRNKFLMVHWKEFDWYAPSAGGIDESETAEQAVEREVFEETGYKVKAIEKLGGEIEMHFFAKNKNVWRERFDQPVLCELIDEKKYDVDGEEANHHEALWMTIDEIFAKTSHKENLIGFDRYRKGNYAFTEDGVLINSDGYDGLTSQEAREKMAEWIEKKGIGEKKVNYKMRDWVFSRQRYWGEPIPIIHCEKCGTVGVSEKDLPVTLPEVKSYEPTGTGESPLANIEEWVNVKCPKCGGPGKRETNTMPQWAGSCWYYLRYIDPKNDKALVDKDKEKYWMPVDLYVGGAEHATRHLLYARFWHKFLYDIGAVSEKEPFKKLVHVGLVNGEDGRKMSKRWGNVINPDDVISEFGADALRLYEMFMGPFSQNISWSTAGVSGQRRFLEKVYRLSDKTSKDGNNSMAVALNRTIKKVTEDIENFRFNTAISSLMILANEMDKEGEIDLEKYTIYLKLLSPFAPHIAEELWEKLGNKESIFKEKWPEYDESLIQEEEIELVVQVNGKLRDRIKVPADISEEEAIEKAKGSEKVKQFIGDKEIRKVIFVKGKLINIVI